MCWAIVKSFSAKSNSFPNPEEIKCRKLNSDVLSQVSVDTHFLENFDNLRKAHKIMNLSNPMLDDQEKEYILEQVKESPYELNVETFLRFYHKDGLGNVLKNVDYWIRDNWTLIDRINKTKTK
jgi:hypothetical protein